MVVKDVFYRKKTFMTLNEDSSVVFLGYFQPPCHGKKDVLRDFFPSNLLRKILQDFMQICKNLLICETYLVVSHGFSLTSIMVVIFVKSSVTIWLVIKCMIISI